MNHLAIWNPKTLTRSWLPVAALPAKAFKYRAIEPRAARSAKGAQKMTKTNLSRRHTTEKALQEKSCLSYAVNSAFWLFAAQRRRRNPTHRNHVHSGRASCNSGGHENGQISA
jgi:hypothetical protein